MRRTLSSVTSRFVLMTVVMCLGLAVFATGAFAIGGGSISGTVYDSAEQPMGPLTVYVELMEWTGSDWTYYTDAWTQPDGTYSFIGLPDRPYTVYFYPTDGRHLPQYYSDRTSSSLADTLTVEAGSSHTGIDAHIRMGNTISGTVTDEPTGIALDGMEVSFFKYDAGTGEYYFVEQTASDSQGVYSFSGLPDNSYKVSFGDYLYYLYAEEFWNDKPDLASGDTIVLAGGETRDDIDAALARVPGTGYGSSISGTITGADTGWVLSGGSALLFKWDGSVWDSQYNMPVDSQGRYLFPALTAGDYRLWFEDTYGNHYGEFFNDSPDLDGATTIAVGEDESVVRDAALDLIPGAIAGTVVDADTLEPIPNIRLNVWPVDGTGTNGQLWTDAFGNYVFAGYPPDDYKLSAIDDSSTYLGEYYDNMGSWESATPIQVNGDIQADIDIAMTRAGNISGQITEDPTLEPIPNAIAGLYEYSVGDDQWYWFGSYESDDQGLYEFAGLNHGSYRLEFYDLNYGHLGEYFDNSPGLLDAVTLEVTSTPVVANASLALGASISGTVREGSGTNPIEGAEVIVWNWDAPSQDWEIHMSGFTDVAGEYTIGGLPYGTYRVSAGAAGRATEYYQETATRAAATDVVVPDSTPATNVDFTLDEASTITGEIVSAVTGLPIAGVRASLMYEDIDYAGNSFWQYTEHVAYPNGAGFYSMPNIPPGTYRMQFDSWSGYLNEYYPEQPRIEDATDIVISTPGSVVPNIDAHMTLGTTISGNVSDTSPSPINQAIVALLYYDAQENTWRATTGTNTNGSGDFSISGVPDGTYRLGVMDPWGNYASEYYNDVTNVYLANDIEVLNGAPVSGLNVQLAPLGPTEWGTIEGTITADATGQGVGYAHVIAYRSDPNYDNDGWVWDNSTDSIGDGTYSMSARAGLYRIYIEDQYGRYLSEYYDDVVSPADATHLTLAAEDTLTVSASLASAATISGTITDETSGTPVPDGWVEVYAHGDLGWYYVTDGYADSRGDYTVGGLEAGTYRVRLGNSGTWQAEYYNDKPTLAQATDITLEAGEQRQGVDASLKRYGRIVGRTSGADGRPVPGMAVELYRKTPNEWVYMDTYYTTEDGTYQSNSLDTGTYIVRARDDFSYGFERYLPVYYPDAPLVGGATELTVAYSDVPADFVLTSTGTWGDIAGTVTDAANGNRIQGITVNRWAWDGFQWNWVGQPVATSSEGTYTMQWVPVGTGYRVGVEPNTNWGFGAPWSQLYLDSYHLDASDKDSGLPVDVTAGNVTSNTDVHATPETWTGYLKVNVIDDATGLPIPNAYVDIARVEGGLEGSVSWLGDGYTNANGSYTRPVIAGQHLVYVDDWPSHAAEYYQDTTDFYASTLVTITATASSEITVSLEALSSISGLITNSDAEPVADITIEVFRLEGTDWIWCTTAYSGVDGRYVAEGLPYGTYRAVYYDYANSVYADEWYNNAYDLEDATDITANSVPATNVDVTLDVAGSIAGTVRDSGTNNPIQDVYAVALHWSPTAQQWYWGNGAYTDASGAYRIEGLAPGDYRIEFADWYSNHIGEYYDNVSDIQDSTSVPVSAGENVTGIDAALDNYATITGTVTDVTNANPLPSTYVRIYGFDADQGEWTQVAGAYNDGSGVYTIPGLMPGTYRVYFEKPGYVYEYYDNQYSVLSAQDIVVGSGETATVDGLLSQGASIIGTVTDPLGDPAAQVTATALRWDEGYGQWVWVASDDTDGSGYYSIPGLGDGIYRVNFTDPLNRFAEEYFNNAAAVEDGQDVAIASGLDTVIDAQLAAYEDPGAGAIAGTIRSDADGTPLQDIVVWVSQYQPAAGGWILVAQTQTSADGSYAADLAPGDYRIEFVDNSSAFLGEWFDDVTGEVWDATDIAVSASTTSSVDASLTPGAHIKGTVTALNGGAPLEGISVTAYRNTGSGWDWTGSDSTTYLGKYDVIGLPAGEYYVEFTDNSDVYQDEYYDDAQDSDSATPIQVASGEIVTGIDAALDNSGSIVGTITDETTGRPVDGARVSLFYGAGPWEWYSVYSGSDGTYTFPGIPPGTYYIRANDDWSNWGFTRFGEKWFNDAADVTGATPIVITNGTATADVALESTHTWGSILGTVTDSVTGAPVGGMPMILYAPDGLGGWEPDYTTVPYTAIDGSYLFPYVPLSGTPYKVAADPDHDWALSDLYETTFYSSASELAFADDVSVATEGDVTADILADPKGNVGWITGTVRDDSSGDPIGGITLDFYRSLFGGTDYEYAHTTVTLPDGTFSQTLVEGPYFVYMYDDERQFLGEWFEDASAWTAAQEISVTLGSTSSIEASLGPAAHLSGTIRDTAGNPLGGYVYLYTASDDYVSDLTTDDGTYTFNGLAPGDYKVWFASYYNHADEWWDDQPLQELANLVTLDTGENATSIDATLALPGRVTGHIDADDGPLDQGVYISAFFNTGTEWVLVDTTFTNSADDWFYELSNLNPGEYRFRFASEYGPYPTIHYGNVPFLADGTSVFIAEDGTAVVDQTMDGLPPAVVDDVGGPYANEANIELTATDAVSGVQTIFYQVDGGDVVEVNADTAAISVEGYGDHHLEYWASDVIGNESAPVVVDFAIGDTIIPTASDNAVASYTAPATIRLTATDNAGGSGIAAIHYRLNGGSWTIDPGATANVVVNTPGSYTLDYKAVDAAGNYSLTTSRSFTVVAGEPPFTEVPIAGDDRFDTSVAVSEEAFPDGADWVVIATGRNWPDALGGSALAGALDGPILLTDTTAMSAGVVAEIERLGATNAIILGGTNAVNASVEAALGTMLGDANVERIGLANRYLTADAVAARTIDELGTAFDGTAFVATGANYPDALAAAPLSAGLHWPLYLTKATGIAAETRTAMAGVDEVLVLGGTAAVPAPIETALNITYGDANVTRLSGADRYATAVKVASHGVASGLTWNRLAIATGQNFPDALAGGVLQGRDGSVMLLTKSNLLDPGVAAVLTANAASINEVRYLGGLSAINQSVRDAVAAILE